MDALANRYRIDYRAEGASPRTVGRYLSEQGAQVALRIYARELRVAGRRGRVVLVDLTAPPEQVVGVRDLQFGQTG